MSNEDLSESHTERIATSVIQLSGTALTRSLQDRQAQQEWSIEEAQRYGLIGDRSGRRIWATQSDFILAVVVSMMALNVLPDFGPLLKGLSFYVFYLLYFQITEWIGATPAKWFFG